MAEIRPAMVLPWLWLAWAAVWAVAAFFHQRTRARDSIWMRVVHRLPLGVGVMLMVHPANTGYLIGRWNHSRAVEWAGVGLTVAGIAFAVWARVHLGRMWSGEVVVKEGHRLVRSGPYRVTRHPIYTGILAALVGTAITIGTGDALLGVLAIAAGFWIKLRREELLMTREFGQEYERFRREVPALVPLWARWKAKGLVVADDAGLPEAAESRRTKES